MGTVIAGEEWSGEGRVIEILNPMAKPEDIQIRELDVFANVAHEGIMFSRKHDKGVFFTSKYDIGHKWI